MASLLHMADIFDVLADATRRQILQVLLEQYLTPDSDSGELSVGEIVDRLGLTQPTVSKHLKVLRDHGLAVVREEGQHRYYTLESSPLEEVEDWLIPFLSADFDPSRAAPDDAEMSGAFTAWSGVAAGEKVGKAFADRSHRARTTIEDVQAQLARGVRRVRRKVDGESH